MGRKKDAPLLRASAVIVAAGQSTRMGGKVKKPYLSLRGRPILSWTLAALSKMPGLQQIVLVIRPEDKRRAQRAARLAKLPTRVTLSFADGGARRQDSVRNGLLATLESSAVILIHDAARPFPPRNVVKDAATAAFYKGAAILAVPVRDTVKRQRRARKNARTPCAIIDSTVSRDGLWLAQTPQVFRRDLILNLSTKLHRSTKKLEVTDDASVCERYGQPVVLLESSTTNLKITRPEDLAIAEAFLKKGLVK